MCSAPPDFACVSRKDVGIRSVLKIVVWTQKSNMWSGNQDRRILRVSPLYAGNRCKIELSSIAYEILFAWFYCGSERGHDQLTFRSERYIDMLAFWKQNQRYFHVLPARPPPLLVEIADWIHQ